MTTPNNCWPSTSKGYKIIKQIGCGSISTVWKAEVIEGKYTGEHVSVKTIELEKCADHKIEDLRKNMLLTNLLDHPNILSCKIAFISKQELWLISEIMQGGSIDKIIKAKYPNGIKSQTLIATILKETLKGLKYLHQNNQIHRDIQASSILVSSDGDVKISGFGVATKIQDGEKRNTFIGSPCWMAPEVLDQDEKPGYDFKADIWSLGITALELAYGKPPNCDLTTMKLILKTLNEEPPKLNDEPCWDESFREFVSLCLVKDASKRKSADELLKGCKAFFSKAKGKDYIKEKLLGPDPLKHEEECLKNADLLKANKYCPKKCEIQFDFAVGLKDNEGCEDGLDEMQIKPKYNHLTKQESENFLSKPTYNGNIFGKGFGIHEEDKIQSVNCSIVSRMLHVEKNVRPLVSKGDHCTDFSFLNEDEF